MKTSRKILAAFGAAIVSSRYGACAQGTFQNLNFESANIPPGTQPNSTISASSAFPKWSANAIVGYDAFSAGDTVISIVDSAVPGIAPLQGNYSVFLFGGEGSPAILSQTGLVPSGTHSMTVNLAGSGISLLIVSLDGQTIQMLPLVVFANYTEYGGDVTAFAGNSELLSFTEQPPVGVPPSVLELDNIIFSPNTVPEPATWTLLLCGAGLWGLMRQLRRQ